LVASSKFSEVSWNNGGTSRPLNTEGVSGSTAFEEPHLFTRLLPSFDSDSEDAANVDTAKSERRDHPNQEAFIVAVGVGKEKDSPEKSIEGPQKARIEGKRGTLVEGGNAKCHRWHIGSGGQKLARFEVGTTS
jgi:hypothetical protein